MEILLKQLVVPPGSQLLIQEINWQIYEQILEELGEYRGIRVNYSQGVLEIVNPLPEHEDDKVMIGDFVKVILEELDLEFRSLGSTTFKSQAMNQGLEADDCFYIENEAKIRGKKRIDLSIDPPPDLAIEIDLTSRTQLANYRVLGVKEVWRFDGKELSISILQEGEYVQAETSDRFPNLPVIEVLPQYLEQSRIEGRNAIVKRFRAWVRERISL